MAILYTNHQYQPSESKPVGFIPQRVLDRLGKGMVLPLFCENNIWQIRTGLQKVQQNMYLTLMTPVGRAMMQPDFGSLLPYMIFERITPTLLQQMRATVRDSLTTWVKEIEVIDVTIDDSLEVQNTVLVNVVYQLINTGIPQTLTIGYSSPDTQQFPPGLFVVQNRALFPP